jgi:hypothetical protein
MFLTMMLSFVFSMVFLAAMLFIVGPEQRKGLASSSVVTALTGFALTPRRPLEALRRGHPYRVSAFGGARCAWLPLALVGHDWWPLADKARLAAELLQ